ncbi:MAG: HEAT repeat domain-containing protein [Planctomycetota bacterium]
MMGNILPLLIAIPVALATVHVRADVFLLTHGGRIEGEWLNSEADPPSTYEIATQGGGHLTLAADQVERVVVKSKIRRQYEAALPRVPDTVEGHWDMAERCREAGLDAEREFHLGRILELSPDHSEARHALGYSRVQGNWVKQDEWHQKQGYVRHEGTWKLPQEIELSSRRETREEKEIEWRKKLRRWRKSILRRRDTTSEALAQMRAVDSPYAIAAVAELLNEESDPTSLKIVYVEILSQFDNSNAVAALLQRVMRDPDLEIRERSIEAIRKHGKEQAVAVLSRALKADENAVINRAAWALERLGDPAAIPALIEAVVTTHKIKVYPGGGPGSINTSMGSGGTGLTMGGKPKVVKRTLRNREVLRALTSLTEDGVNFAYNKEAWKDWWSRKHVVPGINLRRNL